MSKATVKLISLMLSLLFINIEAAQAGLIRRFRVFLHAEFPDSHFGVWILTAFLFTFLAYVVFSPLKIGSERWNWLKMYRYNPNTLSFKKKRQTITAIANTLNAGK